MKTLTLSILFALSFCVPSFSALAQSTDKLLETALQRSVSYQLARSDLKAANEKNERIKSDPLTIKPELLEAQLGLESKTINLTATKLEVRKAMYQEVFAWLEAREALAISKLRTDLANANLNAATVRFKSGAINQLELNRNEGEAKNALIDQENAATDLEGAANAIKVRLGELPRLPFALEAMPKPQRTSFEVALAQHPRVVQARAQVDRGRLDLEIKDNEFSAPVDISNAKTNLLNAQQGLEDSKAQVKTAFSGAWDAYENSIKAVPVRERSRTVAKQELAAQQSRLSKGLVSKLAVQQAQIGFAQAELALMQAQGRLVMAVLGLASAANLEAW
jgi:outer membrane protein TolC